MEAIPVLLSWGSYQKYLPVGGRRRNECMLIKELHFWSVDDVAASYDVMIVLPISQDFWEIKYMCKQWIPGSLFPLAAWQEPGYEARWTLQHACTSRVQYTINSLRRVNGNKCSLILRRAMLRKWRSKHGPTATYGNLAKCFYQADMLDMVELLCQALGSPGQQQGITRLLFPFLSYIGCTFIGICLVFL